jgi:hypothetical protein
VHLCAAVNIAISISNISSIDIIIIDISPSLHAYVTAFTHHHTADTSNVTAAHTARASRTCKDASDAPNVHRRRIPSTEHNARHVNVRSGRRGEERDVEDDART